jgi:hypothetical protein
VLGDGGEELLAKLLSLDRRSAFHDPLARDRERRASLFGVPRREERTYERQPKKASHFFG